MLVCMIISQFAATSLVTWLIKSAAKDFYNPKTNKLTRKKKSHGHVLKLLMLTVGLTQSE